MALNFILVYASKWLLLLSAAVLWVLYKVIYAKFWSPTKHVPGSLLDKVSGLRFFMNTVSGRKMYFAQDQLKKYGPLVEIAPNRLVCNSADDIKTIYGSHEWRKSNFYTDFADFNDTSSLFSEVHKERAQSLRRCFLPAFSRANMVAMSDLIFDHLKKFLVKLGEFDRAGKPLDAYVWTRYLTFEVVTHVGFGVQYDMVSTGDLNHPFVRDFDDTMEFAIIKSLLPFLAKLPLWMLPGVAFKRIASAESRTLAHAEGGLENWKRSKNAGVDRVDILQRLIEYGEAHPEDKLSEKELTTEIMEIMLAGGDTTAATLSYGCWELARNPDVQRRLIDELRRACPDPDKVTLQQLESIPYLDWVTKEMLRTHPTLPSLLERVVPAKGGILANTPLTGGTVVMMSAYIMHQNPSIFPDPEQFLPERWEQKSSAMDTSFLTFSTGPRSCVGQNLATTQIKIHMGSIFRQYRVELHPDTTASSMHAKDFFQGKPSGGKCLLYFRKN